MRFRITVRGDGTELRGYLDGNEDWLREFARAMTPFGFVVASHAEPDYDPFDQSFHPDITHNQEKP